MQEDKNNKMKKIYASITLKTLLVLLLLGVGCTPKKTLPPPPPPAPPIAQQPAKPTVTQLLHQQYSIWKGTPHRTGGTDRRGIDCSGLVQAIYRDVFGMELPRTSVEQSRLGQPIQRDAMQPGDLVYFKDRRRDHVGVVLDQRSFLHTSARQGVMISEFDRYWAPRLKRVSRVLSTNHLAELRLGE
ncbi:hypothetical protein MASR1M90_15820 [Desulfovibrionales bacterium]